MSSRQWGKVVVSLENLNVDAQRLLGDLATKDLELAKRLANVDLAAVVDARIMEAIRSVAEDERSQWQFVGSDCPGAGKFLGGLQQGKVSIAWVRDNNGVSCIQDALGEVDEEQESIITRHQALWQDAVRRFERAYRSRMVFALAALLSSGGKLSYSKDPQGRDVYRLEVEA